MDKVDFTKMRIEAILEKLDGMCKNLADLQHSHIENFFFDTEQLCITMNISKRTAQVWRSKNVIGFSKIGRKYYYKFSDIKALLKQNYVPAKILAK